jgi:hypothetical protein
MLSSDIYYPLPMRRFVTILRRQWQPLSLKFSWRSLHEE